MIIVEGMDNTGKTSLINGLIERRPELRPAKSPGPVTRQSLGYCLEWMVKAIKNPNPNMVYDRYSPISERVYGPVLRQGDQYGAYTFDLLRLTLRRQLPLIIYCRPPADVVTTMSGKQMAGVREHAGVLLNRYDWFMNVIHEMYCIPGHYAVYDWTDDAEPQRITASVDLYIESNCVPRMFTNCFGEQQ